MVTRVTWAPPEMPAAASYSALPGPCHLVWPFKALVVTQLMVLFSTLTVTDVELQPVKRQPCQPCQPFQPGRQNLVCPLDISSRCGGTVRTTGAQNHLSFTRSRVDRTMDRTLHPHPPACFLCTRSPLRALTCCQLQMLAARLRGFAVSMHELVPVVHHRPIVAPAHCPMSHSKDKHAKSNLMA